MGKENLEKLGYIKLHRCLLDNPVSEKPYYAWLWVVLLLKANHKPTKFMWNKGIIIIKEGQFITGRKKLSKETGIPASTVERILNFLENEHQIEQQKTTKFRLITIINWEKYQADRTAQRTTSGQQMDTNKNDKNDKNNIGNEKNVSTQENEKFLQTEYIADLRKHTQPRMRLIGWYFDETKEIFPSKKTIQAEVRRWLVDADFISQYTNEQIDKTFKYVKTQFPDQWKLSTIRKYISKQ